MADSFKRDFVAGWGDMDFNGHMRNTAYLDYSGTLRMMFFQSHGFGMAEFTRIGFGPVIFRDELNYFKEVKLLEPFTVTLQLDGESGDRKRFRLKNSFFRPDGTQIATVLSTGGWLSFSSRKLMEPPAQLQEAAKKLPRTEELALIP